MSASFISYAVNGVESEGVDIRVGGRTPATKAVVIR